MSNDQEPKGKNHSDRQEPYRINQYRSKTVSRPLFEILNIWWIGEHTTRILWTIFPTCLITYNQEKSDLLPDGPEDNPVAKKVEPSISRTSV